MDTFPETSRQEIEGMARSTGKINGWTSLVLCVFGRRKGDEGEPRGRSGVTGSKPVPRPVHMVRLARKKEVIFEPMMPRNRKRALLRRFRRSKNVSRRAPRRPWTAPKWSGFDKILRNVTNSQQMTWKFDKFIGDVTDFMEIQQWPGEPGNSLAGPVWICACPV